MSDSPRNEAARWMPLLVVGMSLNTLGITLTSLGRARFVLMGAGIVLMLLTVVKITSIAKRQSDAARER